MSRPAHLPAGISPEDLARLADAGLTSAWVQHWQDAPARPVVRDAHGWLSGDEVLSRTAALAGRLRGAGLQSGDRLLLSAASSTELVLVYVAALRLGLVVVPVNTSYREREVAQICRDARPALAVVDDAERGAWAQAATGTPVVGTDVPLTDGPAPDLDRAAAGDPALLVYTSGTTGAPKGALLSHGNLLASAQALRLAWRWTPEDRLVLALPLFHLHGLGVGINGSFTAGASVVLRPGFAVDDVLDTAAADSCTLLFGVPTTWGRLAGSARVGELSRLRLCVSGSAPLAPDLFEAVARGGGQRVLERYGMTETVMNVSNPYDGERRPGTVGLPLPGVQVRLDEVTAEIQLRGPNVFAGYWRRPDATAEAFTADGWFCSGDVGAHDAAGYLQIVGRRKELIISGGYNVYPREVEEVLHEHPAVLDVAVVGTPDAEWGERVTAVVVGDRAAEAAVLAHAASRLAPYKQPRAVRWVSELPRNELGKVLRSQL